MYYNFVHLIYSLLHEIIHQGSRNLDPIGYPALWYIGLLFRRQRKQIHVVPDSLPTLHHRELTVPFINQFISNSACGIHPCSINSGTPSLVDLKPRELVHQIKNTPRSITTFVKIYPTTLADSGAVRMSGSREWCRVILFPLMFSKSCSLSLLIDDDRRGVSRREFNARVRRHCVHHRRGYVSEAMWRNWERSKKKFKGGSHGLPYAVGSHVLHWPHTAN